MSSPGARRPSVPWVESDTLEARLVEAGADAGTTDFCRDLARDGSARVDLGEEGRALCDEVVAATDPYFAQGDVYRVQDAWLRSDAVRRLATHPAILARLELAYGRRPFAFQTLSFQRGTEQGVHSDAIHFHSVPERFMCGVWIALEDVAPDAGPLEFVPGSHRDPVLTMQDAGIDADEPQVSDYTRAYLPALHGRLAETDTPHAYALPKKGEALVWAANLAHGGAPIANPASTRRSLVVHVYFEGCHYYTPMVSNPAAGVYRTRLPLDVATGRWVWPRRDGRRVGVPAKAVLEATWRQMARRPAVAYLAGSPRAEQLGSA